MEQDKPLLSIEPLMDERSAAIDRKLFKEDIVKKLSLEGAGSYVIDRYPADGSDLNIKVIDKHASMMYNVFDNNSDYQDWVRQSLHEPTEDEIMQSLRENGTGT